MTARVSWVVPLPEGKIDLSSAFSLRNEEGQAMPIPLWPLAYWSHGSLKWVGLNTVVDTNDIF